MPVGHLGVSVGLELRKQIRVEVKTWKLQLYIKSSCVKVVQAG